MACDMKLALSKITHPKNIRTGEINLISQITGKMLRSTVSTYESSRSR